MDSYGIGDGLIEKLKESNKNIITVSIGETYSSLDNNSYTINPANGDDYLLLTEAIKSTGIIINRIIHLWSITRREKNETKDEFIYNTEIQNEGFYSLLYIAQAIEKKGITEQINIDVVSNNLYLITGSEEIYPEKATIIGPIRVIPQEFPNIKCRNIDIDLQEKNNEKSDIINNLLTEIIEDSKSNIIAHRVNNRWCQIIKPVQLKSTFDDKLFKDKGVYLVTGGFSGIGLAIAKYLAERCQAKLILIGRTHLPDKNEWDQFLNENNENSSIRDKVQQLKQLEEKGSELFIGSADVSDKDQMEQIIKQAEEQFGHISGVIHSAGVAGGGIIQIKESEEVEKVFKPKVEGAMVLEYLFRDKPLDFFILCSSLASITGGFGQVDYCAANAFLDIFAQYMNSKRNIFTISINWDAWQQVGMAVNTYTPEHRRIIRNRYIEKYGISTDEGIDAFIRILGSRLSQILVSTVTFEDREASYNTSDDTTESPVLTYHARPNLSTPYVAPVSETEIILVKIWQDILGIEKIGVEDNFFELGGDSLVAIRIASRVQEKFKIIIPLGNFFEEANVKFYALELERYLQTLHKENYLYTGIGLAVQVPENLIKPGCEHITPDMLPLIELKQPDIDHIVELTPGGSVNIQDIYPLSPLQEGILFHSLVNSEKDVYILSSIIAFESRELLDKFLKALQSVIDRHDILRTAILWQNLREPVQVVWRKAILSIEQITFETEDGDISEQMRDHYDVGKYRIDFGKVPMMRAFITEDKINERWLLTLVYHHLINDNITFKFATNEIFNHLVGDTTNLPTVIPYRNYIAQARLGVSQEEHEIFFREMLETVEEPSAPYGLLDVWGDGTEITETRVSLNRALSLQIRKCAQRYRVSAASICHVAWGRVLSLLCNSEDVVFGTVLFGRMQGGEGSDYTLGMYINTLPIRIRVNDESVEKEVRSTHTLLAQLLYHQHAPLALAQRCSGVPAPAPLFSSLLNYRHSLDITAGYRENSQQIPQGIQVLYGKERTNYPLTLSVDDFGEGFSLTVQVQKPIEPERICQYMKTALEDLVQALEESPERAVQSIEVLPQVERDQILYEWNRTEAEYPKEKCIHELFEEQAEEDT